MPDAIGGMLGAQPQQGLHGSVDSAMSALGGMDSEGFLDLLVAQLKYQDPMKPSDPGDMMMQTATLAQLDATQQLLQVQQRTFGMQQAVAASAMLGTEVTGVGPDGEAVSGVVESVRYTALGPSLTVDGVELGLGDVTEQRHGGVGPVAGSDTGATGVGGVTDAAGTGGVTDAAGTGGVTDAAGTGGVTDAPDVWEGPLRSEDPAAATQS